MVIDLFNGIVSIPPIHQRLDAPLRPCERLEELDTPPLRIRYVFKRIHFGARLERGYAYSLVTKSPNVFNM